MFSIPLGEELARKTFNPRLGIEGGISVIGTTGIVEPMSEAALIETIRVELRQKKELGCEYVLLTPGNYGSDFIRDGLGIDPDMAVQTSNFIGDSLDYCVELGFKGALLIGHIGKLVKIAGNMMNTHSRYGDCRMEILASYSGACGLLPHLIKEMLNCVTCDEALRILKSCALDRPVLDHLSDRISFHLNHRTGGEPEIEIIVFSKVHGILCKTRNAESFLRILREEN